MSRDIKYFVTYKFFCCTEYKQFNRKCNLTFSNKKIDKALNIIEKLNNKILNIETKTICFCKQKKYWLRYLKKIDNIKTRNILELKTDKYKKKKKIQQLSVAFLFSFALFSIFSNLFNNFLHRFFFFKNTVKMSVTDSDKISE